METLETVVTVVTIETIKTIEIEDMEKYVLLTYSLTCKLKAKDAAHLRIFPVRRLSELHGKPDIVRVVSELGIILLSYPSLLMVEVL